MKTERRQFGDLGEKTAARYLKQKGYDIIGLNFRNDSGRQQGEIDIIAKDGNELVFVEVKTRDMERYGGTLPEDNISGYKLLRLEKTANVYLRQHKLFSCNYRFDAVSVWLDLKTKSAKIKHISHL